MRYQVTIAKPAYHGIVDLKGQVPQLSAWPSTASLEFPSTPNTFTNVGPLTVCWIGPDHWLLRTELAQEGILVPMTIATDMPDSVSAILVSDTLSFIAITGADASQVLSIASPLDVHPSVFTDNGVSYTEAFGLKALVMRCEGGFELAVESSYSDMIEDYLQRAVGDG